MSEPRRGYADRCAASAAWAALGDAIGFISELTDEAGVRRRTGAPEVRGLVPWKRRIGGRFGPDILLPKGCYSDDTQLRLATSRAIGATGDFDVEAFAKVELPIFTSYSLGAGRGTMASVEHLRRSAVSWFSNFHERYHEGGGNGVAMRIQPLVWASQPDAPPTQLLLNVAKNAVCTHGHPRGHVGGAFHALVLRACLASSSVPSPEEWAAALDFIEGNVIALMKTDFHLASAWLPEWQRRVGHDFQADFRASITEMRQLLATLSSLPRNVRSAATYLDAVRAVGALDAASRGSGTKTVLLATYLAWRHQEEPLTALLLAANTLGTDTDTIGTMAGALLGAVHGELPPESVADQDYIAAETKRLARVASGERLPGFSYPDLLQWTPPRTSLDAVGFLGDQGDLALAGLGRLEIEEARFEIRGQVAAQLRWAKLPFGQSVLVRTRTSPPQLPRNQWPRSYSKAEGTPVASHDRTLSSSAPAPVPTRVPHADRHSSQPSTDQGMSPERPMGAEPGRSERRTGGTHRPPATPTTFVNLFPAVLSEKKVSVGVGRWTDGNAADRLREDHPGLRTWRDREDGARLYVWFADGRSDLPQDFRSVTVRFEEAPMLFKRMLSDSIESRLQTLGFERKGDGFVNYEKGSLLAQVPALATTAGEPLGMYAKVIPRVHYTSSATGELIVGVVMDVLYTTRLDVAVSEWLAAGLRSEVEGAYVVLLPDSPEAHSYPELAGRSVGRADRIGGRLVVLADRRYPPLGEVDIGSVALEPTRANLAAYLAARHAKAWEKGELELRRTIDRLVRPRRRHQLASAAVDRLTKDLDGGLMVHQALRASFGGMLRVGTPSFPVTRLTDPTYSFDPASDRRVARRVDSGLRDHGPYDQAQTRGRRVRILVVALDENRREVESGIRKLESGVSTAERVFGGLRSMYRLEHLEFVCVFSPKGGSSVMTRYADVAREAIGAASSRSAGQSKFDLALIVIREQFRTLPDSENPYFQTKALALVLDGVPTQAVQIEKLRQGDSKLQYILNTMALACYAKVGGTSHVLNVGREPDGVTELVFGVGRSFAGDRYGSGRAETIGFATVFRANGQYLYNDCTPYCERDQYEIALEETIIRTVKKVAAFEGLGEAAALRLVFHVPRRPGRHEERAVLNAVRKLPQYKIDFALLHVNDDHQFQVFDTRNTTGRSRKGDKPDAALLPQRGLCVTLGPDERLVTFVGTDQYRGYGSPGPLLLRLDQRSTVTDIDYLAQQLYLLSFMNVGSLNPGVAPASITYAEKLARITGHLRGVQQWTVDLINQRLGRKLWFI